MEKNAEIFDKDGYDKNTLEATNFYTKNILKELFVSIRFIYFY